MGSKVPPFACLVCAVLVLAPNLASANSKIQETNSLANIAREQRLKNEGGKQPTKILTNDDLPAHSPSEPFIAITLAAEPHRQRDSNSNDSSSKPHDEEYFRNRMNQLRATLKSDQEGLASLQKEMGEHLTDVPNGIPRQIDIRWTTDPLRMTDFWNSEDRRLRSSIDSMQEKISTDEQDISDFVDQCRHEDCKPGWIR